MFYVETPFLGKKSGPENQEKIFWPWKGTNNILAMKGNKQYSGHENWKLLALPQKKKSDQVKKEAMSGPV